ncbi:MAG: hypothetical protein EA397_20355 [Deltaproteobacteria bacterium]|nr:MAG: hypothetical protein EA397_20355 [Deltaproteobacteria bacterium]
MDIDKLALAITTELDARFPDPSCDPLRTERLLAHVRAQLDASALSTEVRAARAFRRLAFPDKLTGQTTFNRNVRGGNPRLPVADRACLILEAVVGRDSTELSEMCQVAYLEGALAGVQPSSLLDAGFSEPVVLAATLLHGELWSSHYSYYRTLLEDFDSTKLVKGALHLAEIEALRDGPQRWRAKAAAETVNVRKLLLTVPDYGMRMVRLVEELA